MTSVFLCNANIKRQSSIWKLMSLQAHLSPERECDDGGSKCNWQGNINCRLISEGAAVRSTG
jgi:hypothetical protein